jgi:hypothetical protein
MEEVVAYKSSDGNLFSTVDACQEHEFSLLWRTRIDEFSGSTLNQYKGSAQAAMVRKTITAWERFKTGA